MRHVRWDDAREAWDIDFAALTGNAVRARRQQQQQQLDQQQRQQGQQRQQLGAGVGGGGVAGELYELDCRRMEGQYFSYASLGDDGGGGGGVSSSTTSTSTDNQ